MKLNVAICIASELHDGQLDKGGKPYILHPMRVMLALEPWGDSAMVVGVLHDVEEDTRGLPDECWNLLTKQEGIALNAITRLDRNGNHPHGRPAGERYSDYIDRVARDRLATRVKLADLADNLSPARQAALDPREAKGLEKRYRKTEKRLLQAAEVRAAAWDHL